jgi:hypothetical protein
MLLIGVDDDGRDLFKGSFGGVDKKGLIEAKGYLNGMMIMYRCVYCPADVHELACPEEKICVGTRHRGKLNKKILFSAVQAGVFAGEGVSLNSFNRKTVDSGSQFQFWSQRSAKGSI